MITYCSLCKSNINTGEPCYHRQSLLRKLRVYSNKVNDVTTKLENGDYVESRANRKVRELDEYYASLIDRMYIAPSNELENSDG